MLPKIYKFGLAFTVVYVILVLTANSMLNTNIPVTLYPQLTSDSLALGIIAGIITWFYTSNYYKPIFSIGEGLVGDIITAVVMGLIIAIVAGILGAILYGVMASTITSAVWYGIYALIQIPLNGLVMLWLTTEE